MIRYFLRWLLGLKVCVECGCVTVSWGRSVVYSPPHSSDDEYLYECERCSNDGVAYNEMKRAPNRTSEKRPVIINSFGIANPCREQCTSRRIEPNDN